MISDSTTLLHTCMIGSFEVERSEELEWSGIQEEIVRTPDAHDDHVYIQEEFNLYLQCI